MKYTVNLAQACQQESDCLILGVFSDQALGHSAELIDHKCNNIISSLIERGDLGKEAGSCLLIPVVPEIFAERIILVQCGKASEFNESKYNDAINAAVQMLKSIKAETAHSYLGELAVNKRDIHWQIRQAVILTEAAYYVFNQMKSKQDEPENCANLEFGLTTHTELSIAEQAIQEGLAIANGMNLTKDLGNLPGNVCTPQYLADTAKDLTKKHKKLKLKVLEEPQMEKMGMGSLLSVSRGSKVPAKLIVLEYQGNPSQTEPYALVGKGVTFDAGGISIKPSAAMDEMKYDMQGAGSVLGTVATIAELDLAINLVALIPATENLPGGQATKPGDIVTSMSGKTIEILNTDAEGRLILCDALTYCQKEFKPKLIIDVATLTGAMVVSLGHNLTGIFSNQDSLAQELVTAGQDSYDRAWHMPMLPEYHEELKSNFADLANIGSRYGGSITAACFLAEFIENDVPWAHLDIAGTAWNSGQEKGATGRPVALLSQFLIRKSQETN